MSDTTELTQKQYLNVRLTVAQCLDEYEDPDANDLARAERLMAHGLIDLSVLDEVLNA